MVVESEVSLYNTYLRKFSLTCLLHTAVLMNPSHHSPTITVLEELVLWCVYVCAVTSEEYELLLRLNQMTMAKYSDMTALASRLNTVSDKLNEKCESISSLCPALSSPYLIVLSCTSSCLLPMKVDHL